MSKNYTNFVKFLGLQAKVSIVEVCFSSLVYLRTSSKRKLRLGNVDI